MASRCVTRGAMRETVKKMVTVAMALSLGAAACGGATTPKAREAAELAVSEPPLEEATLAAERASSPPAADCAEAPLCVLSGYCSASGSDCVASSDDDCRSSQQCATDGACSAVDHHCVAEVDRDCADADVCEHEGRCFAVEGVCVRARATASR